MLIDDDDDGQLAAGRRGELDDDGGFFFVRTEMKRRWLFWQAKGWGDNCRQPRTQTAKKNCNKFCLKKIIIALELLNKTLFQRIQTIARRADAISTTAQNWKNKIQNVFPATNSRTVFCSMKKLYNSRRRRRCWCRCCRCVCWAFWTNWLCFAFFQA